MNAEYKERREEARNEVFADAREQLEWMMWELYEGEEIFCRTATSLRIGGVSMAES